MLDKDASVPHVLSVAVPRHVDRVFTYKISEELRTKVQLGSLVRVPFGKKITHGFVVQEPTLWTEEQAKHLKFEKMKDVISVGGEESVLPRDVLEICYWVKEYYHAPLGEVMGAAVPISILGKTLDLPKRKPRIKKLSEAPQKKQIHLTQVQAEVLKQIELHAQQPILLEGVTGSGKTEIYIEWAKKILAQNKSVLVLVPEIALTPQLQNRFEAGLGEEIELWHSSVSNSKRKEAWLNARSGISRVVIGARSAVFAPLRNLGLIIVDEEHDPSYKQEERLKYHARDLAILRGKKSGACVLLGSATPSFESIVRAQEGKYKKIILNERPFEHQVDNVIEIVDLSKEDKLPQTQAPFATRTIEALRDTLDRGEQAMVFLNRRGFSSFVLCQDCGEVPKCERCSISLTYHKKINYLKCHQCGFQKQVPDCCEACESLDLKPMGAGTESLEEDLKPYLPQMKSLRLDRDQITSVKRLNEVLKAFRSGEANVLTGTQMLVKGHDFPNVTLVIVVLADGLFRWPDFRANERAFQILTQIAGRAGRGSKSGKVLIQTFQPQHPVLGVIQNINTREAFRENELELRKALNYPPFSRLARLRVSHKNSKLAQDHAKEILKIIQSASTNFHCEVLGPSEAFISRINDEYRMDLLIKSKDISQLLQMIYHGRQAALQREINLVVDMDPVSLN